MSDNNTTSITNTLYEDIQELENNYMIDNDYCIEDLYNNKGLVTGLIKYIYNNYIGDLLNNKTYTTAHRYNDIYLLDNLFNIYTSICYRYNKKPNIIEFSLFTGISRDTLHDWKSNNTRGVTADYYHTAKKWYQECENALVNAGGVFDIFLLKASYNYNDTHVAQENVAKAIESDALPVLGLHNSNIEPVQAITETVEDA